MYFWTFPDPDLWIAAVSVLRLFHTSSTPLFYLSSLLEYKYNIVGGAEDFYGIEGIMEVLVTVPGERKDKIVRRSEFVEERHFHIHPFGICPENCAELSD